MVVSHYFSLHPMIIFVSAAFAYIIALIIFQLLVPRLGAPSEPEIPLSVT
jgi:ACS family hexuronate transporter-like MFS transporter